MQTQRDHVHAHQFQMTRMSNALVAGDPAGVDNPFQRPIVGLLTGILVAVLVAGGFLVYGWLVPGGNTTWRKPGTVIVEKESGDRYIYAGGRLRPVRNMTSALLLTGASATVKLVSHSSLGGVPRGAAIGLPDAPPVLPSSSDLVAGPWMACLTNGVHLDLDPAAPATPLGPDEFALADSGDRRFLVWRDTKFEVTEDAVPIALGAAGVAPVAAASSWLDALPTGEPIRIPTVPGKGGKGPALGGRAFRIGQLFTQSGGGRQRFLLRADGLAPIGEGAFRLLRAVSATSVALSAADIVEAPRSADRSLTDVLSGLAGVAYRDPGAGSLCLRQSAAGSQVVVGGRRYGPGTPAAVLAPGTAVVAYALPLPTPPAASKPWLVTSDGVRYDVGAKDALPSLKLTGPTIGIPAPWLAALPAGPVLSRAAIIGTLESR